MKKIIKSFTKSLPGCATVAVPIVFMMCMMSILGVDIFGNGQMKRCVNEDDVLSYLGGEFTVFSSDQHCHRRTYSHYCQCALSVADGDETCIASKTSCEELFPDRSTLELNITECTQLAVSRDTARTHRDTGAWRINRPVVTMHD